MNFFNVLILYVIFFVWRFVIWEDRYFLVEFIVNYLTLYMFINNLGIYLLIICSFKNIVILKIFNVSGNLKMLIIELSEKKERIF